MPSFRRADGIVSSSSPLYDAPISSIGPGYPIEPRGPLYSDSAMNETQRSTEPASPVLANVDRHPAFGSVVAGGGLVLFLLAGATYVAATMLSIEALLTPAMIGLGLGLAWYVVSRLARVGHHL